MRNDICVCYRVRRCGANLRSRPETRYNVQISRSESSKSFITCISLLSYLHVHHAIGGSMGSLVSKREGRSTHRHPACVVCHMTLTGTSLSHKCCCTGMIYQQPVQVYIPAEETKRHAISKHTAFCFRLIASRFVQKGQDVSKRISRRLGSSSSTGRDMIYVWAGRATRMSA